MNDPTRSEDPTLSRRKALIRVLEVGVGIAGAALLTSGASEQTAQARIRKKLPPPVEPQAPLVSLQLETPDGSDFPVFFHGGEAWVAGREGARYNLRLENHSHNRVEAVVTVDGRDVITGRLGDYVKQRGYVLDPFGVLIIEAYRQSLDKVAAFRFADLGDSYTARMGTPIHAGVIGVAAFEEKVKRRRRRHPIAPLEGEPFPGEGSGFGSVAPPSVVSGAERAREKAARKGRGHDSDAWAAPEAESQLGTKYGESRYSPVEEVKFKRKRRRKPSQLLVVRYDSMAGLEARGITPRPEPIRREPIRREPVRRWREPARDFAPPPPPRDWWR